MFLVEIAALIGTFVLLQVSFASWRLATLAFTILPIAFMGGVFSAFLGGGVLSLGSIVGFITVLGIAARNGILLLSHYQHLQQEEGIDFGLPLCCAGHASGSRRS